MIQYKVGLEYYKNDSGKEMDGVVIFKFESDKPFDEVKADVTKYIQLYRESAAKATYDEEFKRKFIAAYSREPTYADHFACMLSKSTVGRSNIARIVGTDTYWFHLFIAEEMKKQRQAMFDKTDAEVAEHFKEPTLDGSSSDDAPKSIDNAGLTLTKDTYFSKVGVELNGLPDFWMVQAGLV